eukprot:6487549-Amphidinium_carterae.2
MKGGTDPTAPKGKASIWNTSFRASCGLYTSSPAAHWLSGRIHIWRYAALRSSVLPCNRNFPAAIAWGQKGATVIGISSPSTVLTEKSPPRRAAVSMSVAMAIISSTPPSSMVFCAP